MAANANSVTSVGERIRDPKVLKAFLNPSRTEESGDWMLAMHGRTPPRHMEALDIPNNGHITNLPANSIVEVPGDIDVAGPRGYAIGARSLRDRRFARRSVGGQHPTRRCRPVSPRKTC